MSTKPTKVRKIYEFDNGMSIEFDKLKKNSVPGFTHRVVVNGSRVDWLALGFLPNTKSAVYFMRKHAVGILIEHRSGCPKLQFWDSGETDCRCTCS